MFFRPLLATLIATTALTLATAASQAAPINAPVPTNAYITLGGFDWAWANPVAANTDWNGGGPGDTFDISYQATLGWRLPTDTELLLAPSAQDFLFLGANVLAGGTDPLTGATFFGVNAQDGACATPWFSTAFLHCDFTNGRNGGDGADWAPIAANPSGDFREQLVIRTASVDPAIPAPGALAVFAVALAGFGVLRRRRKLR
jgi:hypothetical protein